MFKLIGFVIELLWALAMFALKFVILFVISGGIAYGLYVLIFE